jgi:hypothetical protein
MLVQFDSLPETSRVYYYPSSRKFYPDEIPVLTSKVEAFCRGLADTQIAYRLVYDRFVLFFVSENTPLSIEQNDQLVEFVLDLEKEFGINLLDKVNVCFKQGEFVQRKEIQEFKKLIKSRSVSGKTLILDPMINTKAEFLTNWEVPLTESWLSHLL